MVDTNDSPEIIHIPDTHDVIVQKTWIREQWERFYQTIELIRLDRELTKVDDLYREATARRFKPPIPLRAYIDPSPEKRQLTKFGMEDNRDILVYISTLHLSEANLLENSLTFLIGDLIRFDGDHYEILDQVRDKKGYWANTNIPLIIICACNRYRIGT